SGGLYVFGQQNTTPTLENALINLETQATVVGPFLIFGVLPLIALAFSVVVPWARRLNQHFGLWMSVPVILAFEVILSTGGAPVFERQYLSAMTLLAVLSGVGVALIVDLIQKLIPEQRCLRRILISGLFIVAGVQVLQMANDSRMIALNSTYPDRRTIFAD